MTARCVLHNMGALKNHESWHKVDSMTLCEDTLTLTLTLIHPVSNWAHWATLRLHPCLSRAATSASSQVNPIFRRSLLTTHLQFALGRPGPLLYPGTCQYSACCGMRLWSIRKTCPSQRSRLSLRMLSMVCCPVLALTSTFSALKLMLGVLESPWIRFMTTVFRRVLLTGLSWQRKPRRLLLQCSLLTWSSCCWHLLYVESPFLALILDSSTGVNLPSFQLLVNKHPLNLTVISHVVTYNCLLLGWLCLSMYACKCDKACHTFTFSTFVTTVLTAWQREAVLK